MSCLPVAIKAWCIWNILSFVFYNLSDSDWIKGSQNIAIVGLNKVEANGGLCSF